MEPPTSAPYKIRGTKVTSPYPVKLTPAETRLVFALQKIFDPQNILADCYFPKPDSSPNDYQVKNRVVSAAELLQIDCLALDQRGIFVFESKDYVGWIYGHGDRKYWTQVSAYGQNKHQFYSPILQNSTHIDALKSNLPNDTPIYSVIVFGSDTTLKVLDQIPPDCHICTQPALISTLKSIANPQKPLSATQITTLRAQLNASRINPTTLVRDEHISEIKNYQNSQTPKTKPGPTE